jgi:tetratricopeptide (TPR) repeat protein
LLNQKIDPFDPVNFRIFNIVVHIMNTMLVYTIAYITMKLSLRNGHSAQYSRYAALLTAAVFALHPLQSNAIAYIIQRATSLSAMFVLLSLLSYIFAVRSPTPVKKYVLYSMTALCIILGILSKENAVMALPLLILYDFFFLSPDNRRAFLVRAGVVCGVSIPALVILNFFYPLPQTGVDVLSLFTQLDTPLTYHSWMATDVYWSPLEHVLTEFRVLIRYLLLFILPLPGFFVFENWGYPVSEGLFTPVATFPSVCAVAGLLAFAILLRRRYPYLSFGILWYFIAISLESFFVLGQDLYFEHRNYLPLAGLSFGIVAQCIGILQKRFTIKPGAVWSALICLSLLLGGFLFQKNMIWEDPVTFWNDVVKKAPYNIRAVLALGASYENKSDFEHAEKYYTDGLVNAWEARASTFTQVGFFRLGAMYLRTERASDAERLIQGFGKALDPSSPKLNIIQGYYSYIRGDLAGAEQRLKDVMKGSKSIERYEKLIAYTLLGEIYRAKRSDKAAMQNYQKALSLHYAYPAALHGMSKLFMLQGQMKEAERYLDLCISVDPYNIMALSDKAYLMLLEGREPGSALPFAARAVSLHPPFSYPYLIMGTVLLAQGRGAEADPYFVKAADEGAPGYLILYNKSWGSFLKGDTEGQKRYLQELVRLKDVPPHIKATSLKMLSR